jgi:peroxiredoxin
MSRNLEPGAAIPDFELPDENGALHRLSALQGDDMMVLHLSRGEHCPRERMFHRELLRFHEWCSVAFTQVVSILPNDLHDVYRLKISTGARWTFLSDSDLQVQKHFDINEYTDTHHDYATVPHTLIVSPGLRIERVYVGYWFWGRPSVDQLWADLGDTLRRTKEDFDPTVPSVREAWQARQAVAAA